MKIEINTRTLDARLKAAPRKIQRATRNAINDSAMAIRKASPALLKRAIDRPTPFTTRASAVRVERASYTQMRAIVSISPTQERYLAPAELGQASEHIMQPAGPRNMNRYGNVKKNFAARTLSTPELSKTTTSAAGTPVAKYFIGKPKNGSYRYSGLFMRKAGGAGLERITSFIKRRAYRPQLGIRAGWKRLAAPELKKNLRIQRARPENRL